MRRIFSSERLFAVFLWLVAIHSFFTGVGLILLSSNSMGFFGFSVSEDRFFRTQGGVFHLIVAFYYLLALWGYRRYKPLIWIPAIAKGFGSGFLFIYYFFKWSGWMILVSGIGDSLMFVVMLLFIYYTGKESKR